MVIYKNTSASQLIASLSTVLVLRMFENYDTTLDTFILLPGTFK